MSPAANLNGFNVQSKKMMSNGPRPSTLMINKDSHLIRKPSVSDLKQHKQRRVPIIIYTKSPKVIHTEAQDFMALVQRLTGMSSSKENVPHQAHQKAYEGSKYNNGSTKQEGASETEICVKKEDYDETSVKWDANVQNSSPSNILRFGDMPLYTPNSSYFFCSSLSVFKCSDNPYGILGSLISPSGLEFM
ncbi:hypothetical protein Lal_00011824 [Lupinus albus]|uniref:Uncharacterized protein n=1 Tax=Lupinus albus TaxID=3870 RepID=A0A6A5NFT3_LUPAL|nr:hypothetical protein Lalb_Chr06g0166031 [Lupinus albus]KAF1880765.1 hypothetical protein Lal_00011824 [Lupinus albus]